MFPRLFAWLRRHPRFVDLLWMLPLGAVSMAVRPRWVEVTGDGVPHDIPVAAHYTLAVAMCVPLVWRRRWPRAVFAVVSLAAFAQWLAGINISIADTAVLVAMYAVAAQCVLRWSLAALLVAEGGMLLAVGRLALQESPQEDWKSAIPIAIVIGAIWLSGLYVNTRRKYTLSLEERALRLERERDAQAEVAAAAERARIAREMHDVLAHRISQVSMHAGALAFRTDLDADEMRAKLAASRGGSCLPFKKKTMVDAHVVLDIFTDRLPLNRDSVLDGVELRPNETLFVTTSEEFPHVVGEALSARQRMSTLG